MTAGRVLLLAPAETYRAGDFLAAARRMGLEVVVGSDGALPLPGGAVVRVDPDDPLRSLDRLRSRAGPLDAVVAVDTPMLLLAAEVAAGLGLPHNSPRSVRAALDKAVQRRLWAAAGVRQPAFAVVPEGAGDDAVAGAADAVGLPCVVKPVSLSGSRGVLRADDPAAAVAAARRVRRILDGAGRGPAREPLLVEEYVPGREVSVDGLVGEGGLTVTAVLDRPETPAGPTFEETMLVTPPALPEPVLAAVTETAGRAARALGLRRGPVHVELRVRRDAGGGPVPVVIELAARSIGGLCSRALRFPGGASLEELVLADALGRPVACRPPDGAAGVLMLHARSQGVLRAVRGTEAAASVPGVTGVSITVPAGQEVRPLPEGERYLGFVFATAGTADGVTRALRDARDRLEVVVDPVSSARRPA